MKKREKEQSITTKRVSKKERWRKYVEKERQREQNEKLREGKEEKNRTALKTE